MLHETSPSIAKWSMGHGAIWGAVSKVRINEQGFGAAVEDMVFNAKRECTALPESMEPRLLKSGRKGSLYVYDIECDQMIGNLVFFTQNHKDISIFALETNKKKEAEMDSVRTGVVDMLRDVMNSGTALD